MMEVVKADILKLLDVGVIYPIMDNKWVVPIHVVLKRIGITLVKNKNDELIATRISSGWRECVLNIECLIFLHVKITSYNQSWTKCLNA